MRKCPDETQLPEAVITRRRAVALSAISAMSYRRVLGANERIQVGSHRIRADWGPACPRPAQSEGRGFGCNV